MKKLFLLSILFILIPFIICFIFENKINIKNFDYSENTYIRVKRNSTGNIDIVPFEEYIIGVVSGEMPISFDIEAMKAQALAARSYALTKMNQNKNNDFDVVDTVSNQVYLDDNMLRQRWGNNYSKNIAKVKEAVLKTNGEYITYNGNVINAFFFSTSVGKTENCSDVFGSNLPYLVSVDSKWDEEISPVFSVNNTYSLNDFYAGLDLSYSPKVNIQIEETTSTGRIKKIKINEKEFTGNDVAKLLSLRSSFFKIEQVDDKVNISTKGYGHGVGMSQYGAYGMAKAGYKYDAIIKHYYTGVEISKM